MSRSARAPAQLTDDELKAFVIRTTRSSGVPTKLADASTAGAVAVLLAPDVAIASPAKTRRERRGAA